MSDKNPETQTETDQGGIARRPPTRVGTGGDSEKYVCSSCRRRVARAKPVLPCMAAYVCWNCERSGKWMPILESEIENRVFAPWSDADVAHANEYQRSAKSLPFICALGHALVAYCDGYVCPRCNQKCLSWTYPWILDGTWKNVF